MAPSTQKALLVPTPKHPGKLVADWPVHTPGPEQTLIQALTIPFMNDYPFICGHDGAGVVEDIGSEVTNVAKGENLLFPASGLSPDKEQATFQQYSLVPADNTAKVYVVVSKQAASIPLALNTVVTGLWSHHPEANSLDFPAFWEEGGTTNFVGQPALIMAGSSSVGQYAIQMAKLQDFLPIITTSSLKHTEHLKSLGVTHVLRTIVAWQPLLYVYDAISTEQTHKLAYDALAPGGALIVTSGPHCTRFLQAKVDRDRETGEVPKRVARPFASLSLPANKTLGEELYKRLTEWSRTGVIKPSRVEVLPGGLAGVPDGCARMRDNKVSGTKLVVRPQETTRFAYFAY
ncbi:GroES-like protein [Daedaleopsis nitida]|nr:GroES-like protein [Daedaleopsis nitida]